MHFTLWVNISAQHSKRSHCKGALLHCYVTGYTKALCARWELAACCARRLGPRKKHGGTAATKSVRYSPPVLQLTANWSAHLITVPDHASVKFTSQPLKSTNGHNLYTTCINIGPTINKNIKIQTEFAVFEGWPRTASWLSTLPPIEAELANITQMRKRRSRSRKKKTVRCDTVGTSQWLKCKMLPSVIQHERSDYRM